MPTFDTFVAPLSPRGGAALALSLPETPGLYVLAMRLSDGRSVPLRVGIATGSGGVLSRIVTASTSHYASMRAAAGSPLVRAYPAYKAFFEDAAAIPGATTWWSVVQLEADDARFGTLKSLERALIEALDPVFERLDGRTAYNRQALFRAERPNLPRMIGAWWSEHGTQAAWEDRMRAIVHAVTSAPATPLERVTVELTDHAARLLEHDARDRNETISEVVERLLRRHVRPVPTPPSGAPAGGPTVREAGWEDFLARLARLGLVWDGAASRGNVRNPRTGRNVIVDLNPRTLKGYAFPPAGFPRPAYVRAYAANNAINVGELTCADFDALMRAMGAVGSS
ncbi:MAG: hypothetical protein RLZZ299_909 [Pseudomonadota bacterium]|jgi:hypothetical protein